MEITGKIIKVLEEVKGTSARGEWRKKEYILETQEQYPKKICFNAWGDKIDQFNLQENEVVSVSINIESREYNERWYTEVKAWKVTRGQAMPPQGPPENFEQFTPPAPQNNTPPAPNQGAPQPPAFDNGNAEDDLPF